MSDPTLYASLPFEHLDAAPGDISAYWRNDDERTLVLYSVKVGSDHTAGVKLHFVSGDAAGGVAGALAYSDPGATSKAATRTATPGDAITGLSVMGCLDFAHITAGVPFEFRLEDRLLLRQGDAITVEYADGAGGDFSGVICGYYVDADGWF